LAQLTQLLAEAAYSNAFAESTYAGSQSALRSWRRFCEALEVPYYGMNTDGSFWDEAQCACILAAYVSYEIVVRGLSPDSISKVYLCYITRFMSVEIGNPHFKAARTNSLRFQLILRGLKRVYFSIHPKNESRKLAITPDFIDQMDLALPQVSTFSEAILRRIWRLAFRMGIFFLMRRSEYLPSKRSNGASWEHIAFYDNDGNLLSRSHLHIGQASSVVNRIPFSKTDPHGKGRILAHFRQPSGESCIVTDLEWWAIFSRDVLHQYSDSYIFFVDGRSIIKSKELVSILRKIAAHLDIKSHAITLHSLRYGGATLLAMAGLPQYLIEHYGGWAPDSGSLRVYVQMGGASVQTVSRAMSVASNSSLADTRIRSNYFGKESS